jgi:RNA polymerase sigma-70 factor (ECF subfamily)
VRVHGHSDEAPPATGDAGPFERFEVRDVAGLLRFVLRRTGDPQLAADLTAETFAAALIEPGGYVGEPDGAWLQRTALAKLDDALRRGAVESGARRRLGMERIALTDADAARIGAGRGAALWAGRLETGPGGDVPPDEIPDVATRLWTQLRDAAPRGRVAAAAPAARPGLCRRTARAARGRRTVTAVVAGVVLLAVAAAVVSSLAGSERAPARGPRVVATLAPAEALGRTAEVAFGSVWLSATNDAAILRVDPATRRVIARIPVGTDVNLAAGAGAIWAVPRRPSVTATRLIRIDPRTNRVVARIAVPSPGGRYPLFGASVIAGPRVWVVGAMGLLAVDPARDRPTRAIVLGGDFLVVDSLLRGNELWVVRADRSITRFDVASGRRLGRLGWSAAEGFVVSHGGRVVMGSRGSVALVDAAAGRTVWRTRLGTQVNEAAFAGGRLLVEGANGASARDTLWELDPRTGHVLGAVTVPGFSVNALLRVGGDAWLVTADGHVIVVAP